MMQIFFQSVQCRGAKTRYLMTANTTPTIQETFFAAVNVFASGTE